MKNVEGICPECGNNNLEYHNEEINFENDQVVHDWHCGKCDAFGSEVYDLVFVSQNLN